MTTQVQPVQPRFGFELRQRRLAAGVSLVELSERVQYSKSHVSKVENGLKVPSIDFARRVDAALEANGSLAALVPRAKPDSADAEGVAGPATPGESSRPGSAAPLGLAAFVGAAVGMGEVDSEQRYLEYCRAVFKNVRDLGQTLGPSTVMPILRAQVQYLERVADSAGPSTKREFLVLAAQFADYTGWMAQEKGDERAALAWTDRAATFSRAAGDDDMVAYANIRRALVALYNDDAYGTIRLASEVHRMPCSSHIQRLAFQREAQGYALAGDHDRYEAAIASAEALRDKEPPPDGEPAHGSTNVDSFDLARGWALQDLGRSAEAVEVLTRALTKTADHSVRAKARIGARLALALASLREVEQLRSVLAPILVALPEIESSTIRADLKQLLRMLSRWRSDESVQRIVPALSAVLMAKSAPSAQGPQLADPA